MSWCGAKLSCKDGGRCACGMAVKAELGVEAPRTHVTAPPSTAGPIWRALTPPALRNAHRGENRESA